MERTFSILIVTEELLYSPAIRQYSSLHDKVLRVGEQTSVSFLLPMYLHKLSLKDLELEFDPGLIEVVNISGTVQKSVGRIYHKTIVGFIPKEIGTTSISILLPRRKLLQMHTSERLSPRLKLKKLV